MENLPPRILEIDDNLEARLAVQWVLEREHMHVTVADSAEDGLDVLSRAHFDLVITDLRMKNKSGLDVVQETRSHGIRTPFILMTANADLAIRRVAENMGVLAVLDKPVRRQLLLSHVSEALSGSRLSARDSAFLFHPRCGDKCGFSFSGFCYISTSDIPYGVGAG
jgi:DNA-binding NtrC family response regulator